MTINATIILKLKNVDLGKSLQIQEEVKLPQALHEGEWFQFTPRVRSRVKAFTGDDNDPKTWVQAPPVTWVRVQGAPAELRVELVDLLYGSVDFPGLKEHLAEFNIPCTEV